MSGLNEVKIIGNVGQDPDIKQFSDGGKIANLSIATSEKWKDKTTGEYKEATEWHRIVVKGKIADIVDKYVRKGSKLYVCGKMKTRKWQDSNGQDKYTTEVVVAGFGDTILMLDGKSSGNKPAEPQASSDLEDEIPF